MTVYVVMHRDKIHSIYTDEATARATADALNPGKGNATIVEAHDLEQDAKDERPAPAANEPQCPICDATLTNPIINTLTICPNCQRSIAVIDGATMRATAEQTVTLTDEERLQLLGLRTRPKRLGVPRFR